MTDRKPCKLLAPAILLLASAVLGACDQQPQPRQGGAGEPEPGQAPEPTMSAPRRAEILDAVAIEPLSDQPERHWPQFRGQGRDNIAVSETLLESDWGDAGPTVLWELTDLGQGYAGPAVRDGMVYFHDYFYDQQFYEAVRTGVAPADRPENRSAWIVRCVDLNDGTNEIWRWSYQRAITPNHAITRTVPTVTETRVISFDPKLTLHGLDRTSGEELWRIDVTERWGARIPQWYNGQCPLVDNGAVIVGVGGPEVLMAAVDAESGEVLWETPNPGGHLLTHSSVMVAELAGVRQYLWCTTGGVVGVEADSGELLWTQPWTTRVAVAPSPLPIGDRMVFMTSGYQAGSVMIHVDKTPGGWLAEPMYHLDYGAYESECHTPILLGRSLIGVDMQGRLVRLQLDGEVVWRHETPEGFGLGPFLALDNGRLLILEGDTGILRLLEIGVDGAEQLAQHDLFEGDDVEAWAPMALVDGKLILRSLTRMVCLDLRLEANPTTAP